MSRPGAASLVLLVAAGAAPVPAGPSLRAGVGGAEAGWTRDTVSIQEWSVPWPASRPRDPYVGPAGLVWFVGQTGDYVASFRPSDGAFRRYELEPGTGPHNLIVGEDGAVWYAGNRAAHIGRLDPASGEIRRFDLPRPAGRDPHTLVFGRPGEIWFTVQGGNSVGRLDTGSGEARLVPVPTPNARPYGIVVDADGRPWFTEFGSNRIGTVDPGSFELEEIVLPRREARPRRLQLTSDGAVWYVDYAGGRIGRLDPATRSVEEWMTPGGETARPYAMEVDDRDRLWFVETGPDPNRLVGFDGATRRAVSVTPIPSGAGSVRHMHFHAPTGALWFGTDTNTIGRARLLP